MSRKSPYVTLAALLALFVVMVVVEQAAASDDDKSEYGRSSSFLMSVATGVS